MIENLLYLLAGLFLGLYLGVKRFRTPINDAMKKLFGFLSKLEFKDNHKVSKPQGEIDYEHYHNQSYYCILPGYETQPCSYNGYCGYCPVYLRYKKESNQESNKPIAFEEDYW